MGRQHDPVHLSRVRVVYLGAKNHNYGGVEEKGEKKLIFV
jgi:hypothetical protein